MVVGSQENARILIRLRPCNVSMRKIARCIRERRNKNAGTYILVVEPRTQRSHVSMPAEFIELEGTTLVSRGYSSTDRRRSQRLLVVRSFENHRTPMNFSLELMAIWSSRLHVSWETERKQQENLKSAWTSQPIVCWKLGSYFAFIFQVKAIKCIKEILD